MSELELPTRQDFERIEKKAWDYAERSYEHTHDYKGWEPTNDKEKQKKEKQKKLERIAIGKVGQLWLKRICELNQVPFEDDWSDYTEPDDYDLIICGKSFDTKTTKNGIVPGQINAALQRKAIDLYCFLDYRANPCRIKSYGVISFAEFWQQSQFIRCGEILPGYGKPNKYRNGSNVLVDLSLLENLGDVLMNLREQTFRNLYPSGSEHERDECPIQLSLM